MLRIIKLHPSYIAGVIYFQWEWPTVENVLDSLESSLIWHHIHPVSSRAVCSHFPDEMTEVPIGKGLESRPSGASSRAGTESAHHFIIQPTVQGGGSFVPWLLQATSQRVDRIQCTCETRLANFQLSLTQRRVLCKYLPSEQNFHHPCCTMLQVPGTHVER